jgi:hypothetical protein
MKTISRLAAVAVVGACLLVGRAANAQGLNTCNIDFADQTGLSILPYYQAYGFAASPWYYNWCGGLGVWFNVNENSYNGGPLAGHFHIPPEDTSISCFTTDSAWPNGVLGRPGPGGTCNPINPLTTPRTALPHTAGYMVRVQNLSTSQAWEATQIRVVAGSPAVRVLLQNTDGTWWQYTNLTPGTWNLIPNGHYAINGWIMNQDLTDPGPPINFDNLVITGLF